MWPVRESGRAFSLIAMPVVPYPEKLRRNQFIATITRKPTNAIFRGSSCIVRLAEPTARRRAELAGYMEMVADLECLIALPKDAPKPEPNDETITLTDSGDEYIVIQAQADPGSDCYTLTLQLNSRGTAA